MDTSFTSDTRKESGATSKRRVWTSAEEKALINALKDIVNEGWKTENGFRTGYAFQLEKKMKTYIPGCQIRADPHITSKMHVWKKNYSSLANIKSNNSGLGWNDVSKNFSCEDEKWDAWLKVDPNAKGLRNKPFPHFDDWEVIFGKDRACGSDAQAFADAAEDVQQDLPNEEYDEIPSHATQPTRGPVNDAGQSSGTAAESNSKGGGNIRGKKRRSSNLMDDRFIDVMETFSLNTDSRLAEIAARMGNEQAAQAQMAEVMDALRTFDFLSSEERMVICLRLCNNARELAMFLGMGQADRALMVRVIRDGRG